MPELAWDRLPAVGSGHPAVRRYLRLKRSGAGDDRFCTLQGAWAVQAALDASVPVVAAFACPELVRGPTVTTILSAVGEGGAALFRVSERTMRRMTERDGPDGLAAIGRPRPARLADVGLSGPSRVVVAAGVSLPGNLGTIIRCADGAGADAVLVTESHVRLSHPTLVKASMGTVFSVPVVACGATEALRWLRQHRFHLVAAAPDAELSYGAVRYPERTAIVVGSERLGLDDLWSSAADERVSIPMLGQADSLNVGHAVAVLLYHALHQQEPDRPARS
ncbi:MAG TPA: TrmH family RNA methyltransferase [Acidimicrobiales bacterium]|nr:TrmH family RNA methyltransferase [Acidimicrobiales bacterium]